jgi:DNA-binding MarR family transcriptional regulator
MTRQLQKELKERDPFASLEEEAVLNIHRTADQLSIRGERMLRDYGLTPAQFSILRVLRSEGKALPILEIGNRTVRVVPGITGLIDRLEEAGLVCRQRCTKDRRVVYVALTEKALELMAGIDGPRADHYKRMMGGISEREQAELVRIMEKIREHLNHEGPLTQGGLENVSAKSKAC